MEVPSAMQTPMPTRVPPMGMTSPLDDLIGMGNTMIITDSTDGDFDDTYNDLGYVIPPMGANCGAGAGAPSFVTGVDVDNESNPIPT